MTDDSSMLPEGSWAMLSYHRIIYIIYTYICCYRSTAVLLLCCGLFQLVHFQLVLLAVLVFSGLFQRVFSYEDFFFIVITSIGAVCILLYDGQKKRTLQHCCRSSKYKCTAMYHMMYDRERGQNQGSSMSKSITTQQYQLFHSKCKQW